MGKVVDMRSSKVDAGTAGKLKELGYKGDATKLTRREAGIEL